MKLQKAMIFTLNVIFKSCSLTEIRNFCQFFLKMLIGYLFQGFFKISQMFLERGVPNERCGLNDSLSYLMFDNCMCKC